MRPLPSKSLLLLAIFLVFSSTTFASTLWIFPSIGPSDTSVSYSGYTANAAAGLQAGYLAGFGDPVSGGTGPEAYSAPAPTPISPFALVSTTGFSWMGESNPAAPYDQEHGNSLFFGLAVESLTTPFTMSDVTFTIAIPGILSGTFDVSGVEFSAHTVGYSCATPVAQSLAGCTQHNTGGVGDDTTPINFLFTSGIYISDLNGNPAVYNRRTIDSAYHLSGAPDATSMAQTSAVPEPGTFALLGLGLGLALRYRRRR